ncbi:MAG: DUF3299 domain-containing protein [Pirellulaceae bacterium]|nr:DUF3299 domain-containing protein [Pirellulaceae bacterium]
MPRIFFLFLLLWAPSFGIGFYKVGGSLGVTELSAAEVVTVSNAVASRRDSKKPSTVKDISFEDIKFDIEVGGDFKRSMLPKRIEDYVTKKIKIRGYILPGFQQRGITQFVLVRDNLECCFGPGAALYDCIVVEMEAGKSTEFTVRPIAVEGIFSVQELIGPDGKHLAIYHMKASSAK